MREGLDRLEALGYEPARLIEAYDNAVLWEVGDTPITVAMLRNLISTQRYQKAQGLWSLDRRGQPRPFEDVGEIAQGDDEVRRAAEGVTRKERALERVQKARHAYEHSSITQRGTYVGEGDVREAEEALEKALGNLYWAMGLG